MDRMIGGVGLRRGRRDPDETRVGEALDFWRVEALERDHRILLRAEMKVPGKAWLQFKVRSHDHQYRSHLTQTAFFEPMGLAGMAYWYLLYPFHRLIFRGMILAVAQRAKEIDREKSSRRL